MDAKNENRKKKLTGGKRAVGFEQLEQRVLYSAGCAGNVFASASNMESVPVNPAIAEKVKKILQARGFTEYQSD